MQFRRYIAVVTLVSGILICIAGAAMYTIGSYDWEIPGQIVHRCGMFVFFAGLIGLLASVSHPGQTPNANLVSSAPQASFERWEVPPPPRMSLAVRAALGGLLFAIVLGTLLGLSQLVMWAGR